MKNTILTHKTHYIYLLLLSLLGILFLTKGMPFFLIIVAFIAYRLIRGEEYVNLPLLMLQAAFVLEAATWLITMTDCPRSMAGKAFTYFGSELFLLINFIIYALSTKKLRFFKDLYKAFFLIATAVSILSFILARFKLQDTQIETREELFTGQTLEISPADQANQVFTSDNYELSLAARRHISSQNYILYETASGYDCIVPKEHTDYVLSTINNSVVDGAPVGFLTAESKAGQIWYIRQDPERGFYIVPAYDESLYLTPSVNMSYNKEYYFTLSSEPYYYSFNREYSKADYYWAFWAEGLK